VSILKQGTYALEHGPHLRDAVHGLITKRTEKYLPGLTWRPVSDKIVEPGAWSQVFWRSNRWAGAANREDGDYSQKADLVAFLDEVCRWRTVDERSRSVRAVSIRENDVYASFDSSVEAFSVKDGRPTRLPWDCASPVLALASDDTHVYAGCFDRKVRCKDWTGPPLSGWARALTLVDGALVQVACETAVLLRDGAVVRTLDAGPSTNEEEEWRRHDICALGSSSTYLVAGLVDGSLRRWSTQDWAMDVLPNALVNRAVGVSVEEDGAVVACDAAAVKRFWTSDTAEWRAPAKIAAFASFEGTLAVGLANGEVWLLDATTLAPLRSVEASDVGVASVALSSGVLVVGDAEGVVVAFDL
jgi:WD40 repeat protein